MDVLQIDHKVPIALGGTDESSNLQVACQDCNSRKGSRTPDEYEDLLRRRRTKEPQDVSDSTADLMSKPPGVP